MSRWIVPIPAHASNDDIPYVEPTPAERTQVAVYSLHLERQRRERTAREKAAEMAAERRQWRGKPTPDDAA